jgi:DNA-binding PadR family transcriptional regulator
MTSILLTMPNPRTPQGSSLGLIVLFQLFQGPMHVYRMQKMFEAQGKDRVVNVRSRASLYQTIERLERHGFVEVYETRRAEGYPDRVVYAITEAGRDVARQWLREMLHTTEGQYPEFIAALSLLFGLPPEDARAELELRADKLQDALDGTEQELAAADTGLPRLFLLEEEYRKAMLEAEILWLRGVIEDLREGRLTWSEEWMRELADKFLPADDRQPQEDR